MMFWSNRCIAILSAVVLTFAVHSEGFIAVSKNYVAGLVSQRIKRSNDAPFHSVVRYASSDVDELIDEKELVGKLRSSTVTNINNELVSLGDIMGSEKSVVVFLRHLG